TGFLGGYFSQVVIPSGTAGPSAYDQDITFTHPGNAAEAALPPTDPNWQGVVAEIIEAGTAIQIYRLKEGIERFFITDINNPAASALAQSEIAMMWDVIFLTPDAFNHVPGGANVLYMDGHVQFEKYSPSSTLFPVTP